MLSQILVVSGTASGQTAKISRFIVETLTNRGELPILIDGDNVPRDLSLEHFDGVIIGASVTRGRYQPCVRRFVAQYRDALDTMPSAFFCASGSAATPDARGRGEARACIDDFLRETGWHPALIESLAGVIAFTKYNPFVRWILKQISKRNGGPTDTSRDHEFTDWSQVERFAEAFATTVLTRKT